MSLIHTKTGKSILNSKASSTYQFRPSQKQLGKLYGPKIDFSQSHKKCIYQFLKESISTVLKF